MEINRNFLALKDSYLFSTIAKKVGDYQKLHPEKSLIRLGIGDVTRPLCQEVIKAMHSAVDEMGETSSFHGYGPEQGYAFLRSAIQNYYAARGVSLAEDEIFVSDGAKSDCGNIPDLFSQNNSVLIPDPVYPVYVDTNIMDGRNIHFIDANFDNQFLPMPNEDQKADIIYLCSPNNPTGAVYNRAQLKQWVDFALKNDSLILFDAAYEAFIDDASLPKSIFEIEGAKKCAVEFCSFSKTAGFTGTRCGYTVISNELIFDGVSLHDMWFRRQSTKFNGVSYVVQKAAEATFTSEGQKQIQQDIAYYKENASILASACKELGIWFTGGTNSPYIWLRCPSGMTSWEFFDYMIEKMQIVGTPGAGFGKNGEGYFRLSAFGSRDNVLLAVKRMEEQLGI